MTITVAKLIDPLKLCDELTTAGYPYQAIGTVATVLTGYKDDGTTEAVPDAALAVYTAHDPTPVAVPVRAAVGVTAATDAYADANAVIFKETAIDRTIGGLYGLMDRGVAYVNLESANSASVDQSAVTEINSRTIGPIAWVAITATSTETDPQIACYIQVMVDQDAVASGQGRKIEMVADYLTSGAKTNLTDDLTVGGALKVNRNSTTYTGSVFVPLTTPLTSTSWDGDARSTTAKTLIDLSSVFAVPAGVKAVLLAVAIRDSGSAGGDYWVAFSPDNTAGSGPHLRCSGLPNDSWTDGMLTIPCDANGDVYYQIAASGASTFDTYLSVWGYYI